MKKTVVVAPTLGPQRSEDRKSMTAKKVVVVAPTYNEGENISQFIASILAEVKSLRDYKLELLISDSHSRDKTPEIVKAIAVKNKSIHYLDTKISGPGKLGSGLAIGLDYAVNKLAADYLVTMEADLSCDPKLLPKFINQLEKYDVVIGSRYISGGSITNWAWWRRSLSFAANRSLHFLVNGRINEFTNLYRAFTKTTWLRLRRAVSVHDDWLFVPAFAFEGLVSGLKVIEQPIVYSDRFGGRSKMSTVSYTKNLIHYALRYRLNKNQE